jgi:hypothetical protein
MRFCAHGSVMASGPAGRRARAGAHGRPRFTHDLDVLLDPAQANARRVPAAIADFGFEETERDWRWFANRHITMVGRCWHIDALISISGYVARI